MKISRGRTTGVISSLASALFLGFAPVFGKAAIDYGFSPLFVVAVRTSLGGPSIISHRSNFQKTLPLYFSSWPAWMHAGRYAQWRRIDPLLPIPKSPFSKRWSAYLFDIPVICRALVDPGQSTSQPINHTPDGDGARSHTFIDSSGLFIDRFDWHFIYVRRFRTICLAYPDQPKSFIRNSCSHCHPLYTFCHEC